MREPRAKANFVEEHAADENIQDILIGFRAYDTLSHSKWFSSELVQICMPSSSIHFYV